MAGPIINFTNVTSEGIFRIGFYVYLVVLHDLFWGILGGIIAGGLYAQERSLGTVTAFLILWGVFFGIVLPTHVVPIFGIILGILIAVILHRTFVGRVE